VERILSSELGAHVGESVRLAGWVHRQRSLGRIAFLILRDRAGLAQIVVRDRPALQPETVIAVEGVATPADQAPGGVELHDAKVQVLSAPSVQSPIELHRPALKEQLPMLLDHATVSLRHPGRRAVFRIAAASVAGFRAGLDTLGFVEIQTPKIVAAATEGGADVFAIEYFGRRAYLAQSPQFYKQTMVGVFERVYETGPAFRAEPHDTARHLSEYVSLDAEVGFVDDHRTVMTVAREAVAAMVDAVRRRSAAEAELLALELPVVPEQIPAVDFSEAQAMIERATGEELAGEPDLAPAHERWLGDWARREHGTEFVFVTGFPMVKRPFYTHPDPDRPGFSNSFDLLFRGQEVITGGQRLHRYEDYLSALRRAGLTTEPYAGYLEAFRHGMPPHGGFAIGLEHWVARPTGARNIREATLFPRDRQRLLP
jgi:nondiscriminating aspartyl-tRNA synthetase